MTKSKRIVSLALSASIAVCLPASIPTTTMAEETGEVPVFSYRLQSDGNAVITGCDSTSEELIIPDSIDGFSVSAIDTEAFTGNKVVRSVVLPDGIREIGTSAFKDCTSLSEISVPDSVELICHSAFENTGYTNNISNWEGEVIYIDHHLIYAADALSGSYMVKDGTISIADSAFESCEELTEISIPDSVVCIGKDAFTDSGYYYDESHWSGDILYAGNHAVSSRENKSGVYEIKEGTKSISGNAFASKEDLTKITIPDSVTSIGEQAFSFCNNLKEITLPDNLASMYNYAFYCCDNLSKVDLPSDITFMGDGVFNCCGGLESITVSPESTVFTSLDGDLYNKDQTILLQYALGKEQNSFTVPGSVKVIASFAFSCADNLDNIDLPEGLEVIDNGAFSNSERLKTIIIPDGVSKIGESAFIDDTALESVVIPDSVEFIGEKAFTNTALMTNTDNWDNDILYINNFLIRGSMVISGNHDVRPGTVMIAEGAFRSCRELSGIDIPSSVKTIGANAFYNCEKLESVTLHEGTTKLYSNSFLNCPVLSSVTVPLSVSFIGKNAFGYYVTEEGFALIDGFSLSGYEGSGAQEYASENGIAFTVLERPDVIKIEDGMAQQIVKYSDPTKADYSNAHSEILRFVVYVETDYDTDLDGKPDLVKAFVQLPRIAAEGQYKAPVIYEANPYAAGMSMSSFESSEQMLTDDEIKTMPSKRIPSGSMSTMEVSENAKISDWYYKFDSDYNELYYYDNIHSYDYYLVRGFAFVTCSGLGTMDSEGIQVCGSVPEREAFKDVIEWLHGDRTAYTDRESNISVSAEWCSGKVGMTGLSYTGTLAYEVATTGVEGLETVVPVAGISSWYDFSNSQGISTFMKYNYTTELSDTCASRFFDDQDSEAFKNYCKYRSYMDSSQLALQGDYGAYWAEREYSRADKIKATALIVQGLNDTTVKPKQFDLMWKAFERSGIEPKALLHQDDHVTPYDENKNSDIMIGDHTYSELINLWFSHYLFGVDNGIEKMPAVTAQSNIDGNFYGYESWDAAASVNIKPDDNGETVVSAEGVSECNEVLSDEVFTGKESKNSALWKMDVTSPMTIKGAAEITLRIKCDNIDAINTSVAAALVDTAESEFPAFTIQYDGLEAEKIGQLDYIEGNAPVDLVKWNSSLVGKKIVTTGIMDLKNPNAGYMPDTAVKASEPVRSGEWYEYKLYLQPTMYNVQEGHRLELYIIPYVNGSFDFDLTAIFTPEEILSRYGCTADGLVLHNRDYSFTIDNASSFAVIPVNDTPKDPIKEDETSTSKPSESGTSEEREISSSERSESDKSKEDETSTSKPSEQGKDEHSVVSATSKDQQAVSQTSSSETVRTGEAEPVLILYVLLLLSGITIIMLKLKKEKTRR